MRSFKSKIILLLTLVIATTAAAVMYFTHRDVKLAMTQQEQKAAENVLELVELNIRAGYNQLISDKIEILARMGEQLRQSTRVSSNVFRTYQGLMDDGVLQPAQAQQRAIEWLASFPFKQGKLFVMLNDGTVLHSNGTSSSLEGVRDLKGRQLVDEMRAENLSEKGDRAVFVWNDDDEQGRKHMGYFVPIIKWNWTIGGVINFENIEAESRKELDKIVDGLRKTFQRINIGERGYAFLYDGSGNILVNPPGYDSVKTPELHGSRLQHLIDSFGEGVQHTQYNDPFMNGELVEVFTSYFKAFDWYLTVVVPVQEIQEPVQALVKRQIIIIALVFLVSLVAVFLLIAHISSPLNSLANYAKQLPSADFTSERSTSPLLQRLRSKYSDEVGRLADAINFMEHELATNVRQAIETTAAKERVEREAAEEASRAKGEFLANMSHEIRTPIHGMLGMADLLIGSALDRRQERFARTIKRSGVSLLRIIDDILDFSKIEAMKLELEHTAFDIGELAEGVCEQLAQVAHRKNLEMVCAVAPDCYRTINGDPGRLRQVLVNLCGNAIKFTERGEVVLRVAMESIGDGTGQFRIEVVDSGIGMTEEQKRRIFDAFAQADGSTTRRFGGTGLGLAISRRLVELMSGSMDVLSEPDKGSTFSLLIPFQIVDANADAAASDDDDALRALRVLVVDANMSSQQAIGEKLDALGVEATLVESAAEAVGKLRLAVARDASYDAILIDATLTDAEGLELAQIIRADEQFKDLRLLMFAPMSGAEAIESLDANLGVHCLTKPVRRTALEGWLRGDLEEERGQKSEDKGQHTHAAWATARVLVAEDNPINQELTLESLRSLGITPVLVDNGEQALLQLRQASFDLVLMDCQMPIMDGYEATRRLRELEADTDTHTMVIALTANAMRGDREKCLAAGMDDYLSKPFSIEQLKRLMEKTLPEESNSDWRDADPGATADSVAAYQPGYVQTLPDSPERALEDSIVLDPKPLASIRGLQSEHGDELVLRLVKLFDETAPSAVEDLKRYWANNEYDDARRVAHSLKSNCATLGVTVLEKVFKEIENKLKDRELEGVDEKIEYASRLVPSAANRLLELCEKKAA